MSPTPIFDTGNDLNRQEMLDLLVRKELYLFVGAGLSRRAGIPDWTTLLKEFVECYKEQSHHSPERADEAMRFAERGDIDSLEVILNDTAGEEAVISVLQKHFGNDVHDPLHERLLRLPFSGLITSNYDRCFEAACSGMRERIDLTGNRWFCYPPHGDQRVNIDELFSGYPFLLHIHGCFYHAGSVDIKNMILTRSQYRRFYAETAMREICERLSDRHLLLMGTSFTDQYFLNALSEFRHPCDINERANMPKWYVLRDAEAQNLSRIRDRENYCLHHIYYSNDDDHDGFADLIAQMSDVVEMDQRPLRKLKDSDVEGLGGGL